MYVLESLSAARYTTKDSKKETTQHTIFQYDLSFHNIFLSFLKPMP